jgi:hypothetical protein
MLETLNAVPWDKLGHAYGKASEVPDLIRELASPEQKVYEEAIGRLWYTVIHQGTVYSSTAYVVPFFCELLEEPEVQNKTELLSYLKTIAQGASYADVHVRKKEQRETLEVQELISEELSWVQAASNAVSDGYASYLRLLQTSDASIRAQAADTLSRCQSHAEEVVPEMKQRLETEEKWYVRASLLLSLGFLLREDEETALFFTRAIREAKEPLVKVAGAMGNAFAMKKQASQEALTVLIQSYELPMDVKKQFGELPFADANLDACISTALSWIGPSIAPLVVPTLIRAVRQSDGWSGLTFVPSLLSFVFDDRKITSGMTVSDLTDLQRDALTAIYETESLWLWGNMSFAVGEFFSPRFAPLMDRAIVDRDELGNLLAGAKW